MYIHLRILAQKITLRLSLIAVVFEIDVVAADVDVLLIE